MQNNSSVTIRKFLFLGFASSLFLLGLFFYQQSKLNDGNLHLVFCDVGQGDGIFVRSPKGLDILIDGGPDDSILSCLSNNMPFWDRTIEVVILTHPHADHATGLISVIKRYSVLYFYTEEVAGQTLVYEELINNLAEKKIAVKYLKKGDKLKLKDEVLLETLWPTTNQIGLAKIRKNIDLDANGLSIVSLLSYGNFSALLTGDALLNTREVLDQKVDVLKVPHHGSRNNVSLEFLRSISPVLAVIQAGKNNRYGHPHKETLKILGDLDIRILRNDLDGEVKVVSDGKRFWVQK